MPSLPYVGPETSDSKPRGIQSKSHVETQLTSGVTQEYVQGRVDDFVNGNVAGFAARAPKSYVDTQDGLFAETTYYQEQDALLVPISSKGQPNGVASLDSSSKIPSAQVPALGAGTIKGRYGLTATFTGTANTTPLKIAEFDLGVAGVNFKPLVFMNVLVTALNRGRPRVEVKIGTTAQTTYASQTLVAAGSGRSNYNDVQPVAVKPNPDVTSAMQDGVQTYYGPNTAYILTAWLFETSGTGQITIAAGQIATAAAYLLRVVQ